jgi:hypothetical protein
MATEKSAPAPASAQRAQRNSEMLKEMYLVVLRREPQDKAEFGNWVDSLNQGASIEGVYNGFVHSSVYKNLEAGSGAASAGALKVFGELFSALTQILPEAQRGDLADEHESPAGVDVVEFKGKKSPAPESASKKLIGTSLYALKRILGDEALKVVAHQSRNYRGELAQWYSKWAVSMNAYQVDFGLALRHKPEEKFHYDWALAADDDQIRWEVLNRIHRVMNEADRQK